MSNAAYIPKLWSFFIKINDYFENVLKPLAKKYGLTVAQLKIIYFTHKFGSATVGSIAYLTGFARTNTSSMCKKLSNSGFLLRRKNKADERVVELELTAQGMVAAEAIELIMQEYEEHNDKEDLKALTELLSELIMKETKGQMKHGKDKTPLG